MSDQFIGVDVGGTKIAVSVLENGVLSESVVTPTNQASQEALVEQIATAIEAAVTPGTRGVGIGMPSIIEFKTGKILASVNIPLHDIPLRSLLTDRLGVPVYVENDAGCAALAEAFDDGRIVVDSLVMLTIGTGVGGGWVLNGKLYRGATTSAAEVGHTIIGRDVDFGNHVPGDPFPQRGSLETLASGRALDRLADYAAIQYPDSHLGKVTAKKGNVDGHDVVAGAEAGDDACLWCLRVLGERIGIGIANAINTFDPLEVVLGGGVSRAGALLLEPARDAAFRHVVPGLGLNTTIRIARHGPRAGVLGAALIAAQEYAEDTGRNLQGAISGEGG
ncbi:ROK family protein [Solirubrobacter sp. CPCC 204708]|uniref:ROK family protein n=1 Tax=Solirubrobacter deserti TaxID=2282478 RepID=A0ABT4RJG1_9ACTN|nr:ROK family protein [Solirubrobacter deserti]MBE2320852.1 ROK family protein [Solirubrobacter deserti]MDA0138486.1 ROK family protein [Solirubrobacter deserti]